MTFDDGFLGLAPRLQSITHSAQCANCGDDIYCALTESGAATAWLHEGGSPTCTHRKATPLLDTVKPYPPGRTT